MTTSSLSSRLAAVTGVSVAVFGDFSLDAYWDLSEELAELSVETGLPVRRVDRQRYSLGGAGNVVATLHAMGVRAIRVVGVCGTDPFGRRMLEELAAHGADFRGFEVLPAPWETLVYAKPHLGNVEEQRLDFGSCGPLPESTVDSLAASFAEAARSADVVIINQQIKTGMFTSQIISRLNKIIAENSGTVFVVDSRDMGTPFRGAVLKLNALEASGFFGDEATEDLTDAEAAELAGRIAARTGRPVFLTRGQSGMVVADGTDMKLVLPVDVGGRVDAVGAGDTVTAAIAVFLALGMEPAEVAFLANLAASLTVRKLRRTGADAATPEAIVAAAQDVNLVYAANLADDPTRAVSLTGTEFELVDELDNIRGRQITHAIFDHDGTLSTLRQGWEEVMEPMMLHAILGPTYGKTSAAVVSELRKRIAEFIDRTTGIQTLAQMQGLVELVQEFGFVPEKDILDEHGYKAIYNEALLEQVNSRLTKLRSGQLAREDFHIKNSIPLLRALGDAGVELYLVSGTDEADVVAEANELGFGEFFGDRIYGSIGSVAHEAKSVVLERIIRENQLAGSEVMTFGDGPVEMRETRKRGGLSIGVCSDEVRRFGFNSAKRRRLIRGGAQLLVPDYSDLLSLLDLIGIASVRSTAWS